MCKKELLSKNRNTLRFVHDNWGYDFKAPHYIGAVHGRFTARTLDAAIRQHIPGEYRATLLIRANGRYGICDELYCAQFNRAQFDIRYPTHSEWGYNLGDNFRLDHFWSKADFEEVLKNHVETCYIVAQPVEYIKTPKKPVMVDLSARYRVVDRVIKAGDGRGNAWISQVPVQHIGGGDAAKIDYEPYKRFTPGERSADLADVIDKSGYLLEPRKAEQRRKLADLKAQRAREVLARADFAPMEKAAAEMLRDARETLAGRLRKADTAKSVECVKNALWSLKWGMLEMQRYQARKAAGEIASVDEAKWRLEQVEKYAKGAIAE